MGNIEPRTITLRDGTRCLLRCAEVGDAPAILAYRRAQIGTHAFEINLPDEVDLDPGKQREMIQESLDKSNWVYILALPGIRDQGSGASGQVLGGLLFRGQTKRRMQHHGTFGIAIDPGWRGRGIGRAMIEALLDWAAAHPSLVKVCLAVFANNSGATALYRSLGFVEEGRSLRHFQMEPGRFIDDVSMCVYVKPGVAPAGFNTWEGRRGAGHRAQGAGHRAQDRSGKGSGAGGQRRERRTGKSRA